MREGGLGLPCPGHHVSPRGCEPRGGFVLGTGTMASRAIDESFMRRALALAERARGATRPNPIVGAVVVKGGRVVGEGWHRAAGLPHAEAEALARAGTRARGA